MPAAIADANPPETPVEVSICQLKDEPAKYNHKLVKVTGFVSHGFEDFALSDPMCKSRTGIWLDYGGPKASDTMYCCGVVPGHTRPEVLSVEGITIPLVADDRFKEFDRMIKKKYDLIMHTTMIGRFFSGEKEQSQAGGEFWSGYGHLGCCTLFIIQQVVSVDAQNRNDLDYGASSDQPEIEGEGCGYSFLGDTSPKDFLAEQRAAESGERAWAFDDPQRVAVELLAKETKREPALIKNLTLKRRAAGRMIYTWKTQSAKASYMVVVSRPYILSFYARDPEKLAWVVRAAYRFGCGDY